MVAVTGTVTFMVTDTVMVTDPIRVYRSKRKRPVDEEPKAHRSGPQVIWEDFRHEDLGMGCMTSRSGLGLVLGLVLGSGVGLGLD